MEETMHIFSSINPVIMILFAILVFAILLIMWGNAMDTERYLKDQKRHDEIWRDFESETENKD